MGDGLPVRVRLTRANLRETLPDLPSRQALTMANRALNRAARLAYGRMMAPTFELGEMTTTVNGRLYFNLDQFVHCMRVTGQSPVRVLTSLGHSAELTADDTRRRIPKLRALPSFLRLVRITNGVERHVARFLEDRRPFLERVRATQTGDMSDDQLASTLQSFIDELEGFVQVLFEVGSAAQGLETLFDLVARRADDPRLLMFTQIAIGDATVTTKLGLDLRGLITSARTDPRTAAFFASNEPLSRMTQRSSAEFVERFNRFLSEHGHRGVWETDHSLPRYAEDPSPILSVIRRHLQLGGATGEADESRLEREAVQSWERFARRVPRVVRPFVLSYGRKILRGAKLAAQQRELLRSEMVRRIAELRRHSLEAAERLVRRGLLGGIEDFFHLDHEESIDALLGRIGASDLISLVGRRKVERAAFAEVEMPLLIHAGDAPPIDVAQSDNSDELVGLCVSPGLAVGPVVVLADPTAVEAVEHGAILVAPATDPSWVPLMTLAGGVIVEIGGVFSHAAIVSRELGLPALANVPDATKRLRTGDYVELDATGGVARIVKPRD